MLSLDIRPLHHRGIQMSIVFFFCFKEKQQFPRFLIISPTDKYVGSALEFPFFRKVQPRSLKVLITVFEWVQMFPLRFGRQRYIYDICNLKTFKLFGFYPIKNISRLGESNSQPTGIDLAMATSKCQSTRLQPVALPLS